MPSSPISTPDGPKATSSRCNAVLDKTKSEPLRNPAPAAYIAAATKFV